LQNHNFVLHQRLEEAENYLASFEPPNQSNQRVVPPSQGYAGHVFETGIVESVVEICRDCKDLTPYQARPLSLVSLWAANVEAYFIAATQYMSSKVWRQRDCARPYDAVGFSNGEARGVVYAAARSELGVDMYAKT
jgi:hypothetical protein